MSRRGKVEALPGPVKTAVDQLLATGRYTLDQIVTHLRTLADSGAVPAEELPSRSGLGRYAQRFEAVAKRMRLAQEVAGQWKTDILKDPETDLGQAVLSMIETAVMEVASQADGETEVDQLELLGRAAKHIAQARATGTKRILALMAKAEERQRAAVQEERSAAAERGRLAASELGLSADQITQLQARIAGVTV